MLLCVAYSTKNAGDARQSLDLLMKLKDPASDGLADVVTGEHINQGCRDLKRSWIREKTTGLTQHGHLVLYALSILELDGEMSVRSRDIRPRYTHFGELANRDPLVPRRMRDHLFELVMPGIVSVTERDGGRRGGTFREHGLDMDKSLLLDAMDDIVEDVGVHASVQDYLINDPELDVVDASIGDFDSGR